MASKKDIPESVLNKIKEYAFLQYGVSTIAELKAVIVDEQFNKIINNYLGDIKLRLLRTKADEAKAYEPTEVELVERLQAKIDAFNSNLDGGV